MANDKFISIISPATGEKEVFCWTFCRDNEVREENSEIVDIIHWIVEDIEDLSFEDELCKLLENVDRSSYVSVFALCAAYNKCICAHHKQWQKSNVKPPFLNRKASQEHVQFILCQCYNRAVAEPDKLNQYPPFSPQVYGETSFELISQMIDTVELTSEDIFIDLGSGVGQVVLQVAACSDAKYCFGIEKAEYPSHCACRLDSEFRHWMSFYGKSYRPYLLERGDFLSPEYQEKISTAGVLFANNFAFGPEVDHQLKQRFANLKEGARIISSKEFCPLNFRITDRNLGDIGSIMHVRCLNPIQDAVSWTDKPFSYYVHTIDRSLLERYFSRLKNPKLKDEGDLVRRDRKGRIISDRNTKDISESTPNCPIDASSKDISGIKVLRSGLDRLRLLPIDGRGRRSKSLECSSGYASKRRDICLRNLRSKRHVSKPCHPGSDHFNNSSKRVVVDAGRSRRSASVKSTKTTDLTGLTNELDVTMDQRLASLSLTSASTSDVILRSSSFPTFGSFPGSSSGHTTPTGSTSISSTAFSNDDVLPSSSHLNGCHSPPSSHTQVHPNDRTDTCWSSITPVAVRSPAVPCDEETDQVLYEGHSDPLRVTLTLSSKVSHDSAAKPTPTDDKTLISVISPDLDSDSSVAKRRTLRKCRQLSRQDGISSATTHTPKIPDSLRTSSQSGCHRSGLSESQPLVNSRFRKTAKCSPPKTHHAEKSEHLDMRMNLDLLHGETELLAHKKPCSDKPAARCNEPQMSSYTCHYKPYELHSLDSASKHMLLTSGDPNIGHSNDAVPLALTQYLAMSKRVFMDYFSLMRSPSYASTVRRQLAVEQARHAELLEHTRSTEQAINKLHADGTELLRKFTKRLGILITTPSAFFAQARRLIKHHHALEAKIVEFRKQISELSSANQELVRRHQVEAARLLSSAISRSSDVDHSAQDLIAGEFTRQSDLHLSAVSSNLPPTTLPSTVPQFILPPRKRAWESLASEQVVGKHPRNSTLRVHSLANWDHPSPPTLSPVEAQTPVALRDMNAEARCDRHVALGTVTSSSANAPPPLLYSSELCYRTPALLVSDQTDVSSLPPRPLVVAQVINP